MGGDSRMASAPDSAGPGSSRARLYFVRDLRLDLIAEMTGCARDGAALQFEELAAAAAARVQQGDLLLVIIQDDRIEKMARLVYHRNEADEEEEGKESGGYKKAADDEEEKEESRDEVDRVKDALADVCQKLLDMTVKDDDDDSSDEEVWPPRYSVMLRLWASHATLVLYDHSHWNVNRQYAVHWLKLTKKDETPKTETKESSSWPEVSMPAFQGYVKCSEAAQSFINSELSPHVDEFKFIEVLGVTLDCKVYRCSYVDTSVCNAQFALKKIQITDQFDDEGAVQYQEPREVNIFSSLKDSSIITFYQAWAADGLYKTYLENSESEEYGVCEDAPNPRYVIIQMKLCFRTLDKVLSIGKTRVVDVEWAWTIFREITKALKYMHQNGVIHRDLKPGNIFFVSPGTYQVIIGDFGHSCWSKHYLHGKKGTPLRGTPMYSAPELKKSSDLTDKADIFSLGVILVELFHCFATGRDKYEVLGGLGRGIHPTQWGGDTVLLKQLTALSPWDRPSATEILDHMSNHQ